MCVCVMEKKVSYVHLEILACLSMASSYDESRPFNLLGSLVEQVSFRHSHRRHLQVWTAEAALPTIERTQVQRKVR